MEKKSVLGLGIFLVVILVFGSIVYNLLLAKSNDEPVENETFVLEEEDFNLEYQYKGENLWQYTVTGQIPNPCYNVLVESMVAESYPEQVTIKISVSEPDTSLMCTQVIQEIEEMGEFQASPDAQVTMSVDFPS